MRRAAILLSLLMAASSACKRKSGAAAADAGAASPWSRDQVVIEVDGKPWDPDKKAEVTAVLISKGPARAVVVTLHAPSRDVVELEIPFDDGRLGPKPDARATVRTGAELWTRPAGGRADVRATEAAWQPDKTRFLYSAEFDLDVEKQGAPEKKKRVRGSFSHVIVIWPGADLKKQLQKP
jgi:hypothetical protein